ncbi:MAG: hypothetical protein P8172_12950 [Gammaproteobacteria bacterium]
MTTGLSYPRRLLLPALAAAALSLAAGAAIAQDAGDIVSAQTRAYAAGQLDEAEAAFARGDMEAAWKGVEAAAGAPTEFHGRGLANISSRALGDELYGRIYDLRRRIRIAQGRQAESEGLVYERPQRNDRKPWQWDNHGALGWYMAAPDPDAILRLLREAPADRQIITGILGSTSVNDQGEIVYGVGRAGSGVEIGHEPLWDRYEPIPMERQLQQRFEDDVVPAVLARIRSEADRLLAEEQTLHDAPPTEMEQQVLSMSSGFAGVSEAVTGFREEQPTPEIQLLLSRADDSERLLEEARQWLQAISEVTRVNGDYGLRGGSAVPVVERAADRAEEMMAIGDDESVPILARDDAYEHAEDYYVIADDRDRAKLAYSRNAALQPEIDEYLARRNAAKDAAQEKFAGQAAAMEQAVKDMEKTEEEKKEFEEEADALEDELGF